MSQPPHESRNRCIKVLRRKVSHATLALKLRVCAAGRLSARGKYLKTASRKLRKAATITLKLPLTSKGVSAVRPHRPLKMRVRVVLVPAQKGLARASASTNVAFKH